MNANTDHQDDNLSLESIMEDVERIRDLRRQYRRETKTLQGVGLEMYTDSSRILLEQITGDGQSGRSL